MIVISKDEAYESVRKRVWFPPACDNKEEHIKFLFKGCQEMDIVFCKDCRHKVVTKDGEYNEEDIVCDYWLSDGLDSNDFCSYGERSEK